MDYQTYLDYFTSEEPRASFMLREGTGKVMISAPHSVEQLRKGQSKYAEYQTGILACMLHDALHCPVIYKTHNCGDDANYDPESPYKEALLDYIRTHEISYLLDLHQLAPWREQDIDLGTGRGKNMHGDEGFPDLVQEELEAAGLTKITRNSPFSALYPYTVSSYISDRCGIPCLQIEINSRLVCEGYEEFCFEEILEALKRIVMRLNAGNEVKTNEP